MENNLTDVPNLICTWLIILACLFVFGCLIFEMAKFIGEMYFVHRKLEETELIKDEIERLKRKKDKNNNG